jgi:hypothetical protein
MDNVFDLARYRRAKQARDLLKETAGRRRWIPTVKPAQTRYKIQNFAGKDRFAYVCPECLAITYCEENEHLKANYAGGILGCEECLCRLWQLDEHLPSMRLHRDYPLDRMYRPQSYWSDPRLPDEVAIATIFLKTVKGDLITVYARETEEGIRYRVKDSMGLRYRHKPYCTDRPLTMGELIRFMDEIPVPGIKRRKGYPTGLVMGHYAMIEDGLDVDDAVDFAHPRSRFYSELTQWYEREAYWWRRGYLEGLEE